MKQEVSMNANHEWLLDSDPALKWQVERDLLGLPESVWAATRELTNTTGFGARLIELQDEDGQWAGGAYFPGRVETRALTIESDEKGQPYIATTWTLNALREWGVSAETLGDTADRLAANSRWEYDDLPYWGGEVDCCINAFTLCNGAWLGVDVSKLADWFLETQLADGGWNCDWVEGATKSSFHSTLNSLIGLLEYEQRIGFRDSAVFSGVKADERLTAAADFVASQANENGRWVTNDRIPGSVWFDVDSPIGEESKWLTFFALRALNW